MCTHFYWQVAAGTSCIADVDYLGGLGTGSPGRLRSSEARMLFIEWAGIPASEGQHNVDNHDTSLCADISCSPRYVWKIVIQIILQSHRLRMLVICSCHTFGPAEPKGLTMRLPVLRPE